MNQQILLNNFFNFFLGKSNKENEKNAINKKIKFKKKEIHIV